MTDIISPTFDQQDVVLSDLELDAVLASIDSDETAPAIPAATVPATMEPNNAARAAFYRSMLKADVSELQAIAKRIRDRHRASIIDTGRDLLKIHDGLPRLFGSWLEAEFSMSKRTAYNYINAFKQFGHTPKVLDVLPPSTVYKLAAKGTPATIRQAVVAEIEAGKVIDHKAIETRINEAKEIERTQRTAKPATPTKAATTNAETAGAGENEEARKQAEPMALIADKVVEVLKNRLGDEFETFRKNVLKIGGDALINALRRA